MTNEIKAGSKILADSKILAEFEGRIMPCNDYDGGKYMVIPDGNGGSVGVSINSIPYDQFTYHTDYNELMRVVHKMYDVADEYTKQFGGFEIFELGLASPIGDIFNACVKFAEWYNSLKPKEEK